MGTERLDDIKIISRSDSHILIGQVRNQPLLAKMYSLADVFVICSKRENFPTTCIEAQCCGIPVAGFDAGGAKETSVYGGDDFVRHGDIAVLRERVEKLLSEEHPDLAEKAQKAYASENMAKRYMEEYDRAGKSSRVLLIDVNCGYSSTGKIVYDIFRNLRREGREAAVCYGRGEKIEEEGIYKFGLDAETYVHAGLARITGYNGCFSPFSTRRLIGYIERFAPDVIHIHELHAYFVSIKPLLRYIRKKKIKVVWTFHCEYMYTGKCGHSNSCSGFTAECGNCPELYAYPKSLFFDRTGQMLRWKKELLSDLDMTIAVPSQWLADRVKMSFLKDRPIKVVHNGIDTGIFHPVDASELKRELGIPSGYKVVLSVAPDIMSERKGGKWVLELAEAMKGEPVKFILLGVRGGNLSLDNAMVFGLIKDQNLLAEYYSMADVFVICSKRETFSMTTAEALCCGTMVAGFKAGAPETIAVAEYSAFVEYGDIGGLENAVREMLVRSEGVSRAEVALRGREKYRVERMVDEYCEIYADIGKG